jgi:hypothetical protein
VAVQGLDLFSGENHRVKFFVLKCLNMKNRLISTK